MPGSPPPARIGSRRETRSPSPSIRRSMAPPLASCDRSSCPTRRKLSLSPIDRAVRADERRLLMASRPVIRTAIALGIALTLGAPLTASAQAGGGAGPAPAQQGGAPPAGAQG